MPSAMLMQTPLPVYTSSDLHAANMMNNLMCSSAYDMQLGWVCLLYCAGCLAGLSGEEMGLGKTVEIAALMLSRPAVILPCGDVTLTANGRFSSRCTLLLLNTQSAALHRDAITRCYCQLKQPVTQGKKMSCP